MNQFHPLVQRWFIKKYNSPTPIQTMAWPDIEKGSHCLLSAPTGSGKTLAAFLSALNGIITRRWSTGVVRVLYISPLKALNNDIQKNLLIPLGELREIFRKEQADFPEITIGLRSGDTSQKERQRMLRHPPSIFVTTPESLNLLLSSPRGRTILTGIQVVILDEIHAVLQEKRGTHLITGIERLTLLAGEFQRIALSATLNPMSLPADYIGGFRQNPGGGLEKREVHIHQTTEGKTYEVAVDFPEIPQDTISTDLWWEGLSKSFCNRIQGKRSTLVFANSRRMVEKMTRLINNRTGETTAWSHHGSLSRELRLIVEEKLKAGDLKSIVATNSLELGIDIGELDQVLLLQAPGTIASTLQKLGRAGHGVDRTSLGRFYPLHSGDLIQMAVCAKEALDGTLEPAVVPEAPLDVLAQVLLSMTLMDTWDIDELFEFIKTSYPYRSLSRLLFDAVLHMLAGRYEDSRIKELTSRVFIDPVENSVKARDGQSFPLYLSGGTIPDRGYYTLRAGDSGVRLGELDEEFVWERTVGDLFQLGTMTWRITSIGEQNVEVAASKEKGAMYPFWKGDTRGRSFQFSEKIGLLLEQLDEMSEAEGIHLLEKKYYMTPGAAEALLKHLIRQKKACDSGLPHRHRILLENYSDPANNRDLKQVVLHNFWGGRVNRPLAMILRQAWEEKEGYPLDIYDDEDSLIMNLPHKMDPAALLNLLHPDSIMTLLKKRLEMTGYFGARFRENAGRALLLPKKGFGSRTPLWLNRLRSRKLLAAVLKYKDFPITLETWRTCLNDEFDLETLGRLLVEVQEGDITIDQCWTTKPSPFCSGNLWRQINEYMYQDDTPSGGTVSATSETLLEEVMANEALRPLLPSGIISTFTDRMKRTARGYSPESREDLLALLQDRVLIPLSEWDSLKESILRDHGPGLGAEIIPPMEKRFLFDPFKIKSENDAQSYFFCLRENFHKLKKAREAALGDKNFEEMSLYTGEVLGFYGPVAAEFIMTLWNITRTVALELIEMMEGEERILRGHLTEENHSETEEYCRRENFEILLRMLRHSRRPQFEPLPSGHLPLFLACHQGLTFPGEKSSKDLRCILETLILYPAPFSLWESDFLPSRLSPYYSNWLDALAAESTIQFTGTKGKQLFFSFPDDRPLLPGAIWQKSELIPEAAGYFDFWQLKEYFSGSSTELTKGIWNEFFNGAVSNSTFAALRKGALQKWKSAALIDEKRVSGRGRRGDRLRWEAALPSAGLWFPLPAPPAPQDHLEAEEYKREKIGILLDRYGFLCRPILKEELPGWQWRELLPALRLMELAGEILSGYFFEGMPGPQFISHKGFRRLSRGLPEDKFYWMNACDPISPCSRGVEPLKEKLPRRLPGNHLVFRGPELLLVSRKNGKDITLYFDKDEIEAVRSLEFFRVLHTRDFSPRKRITIEIINGVEFNNSPYLPLLEEAGFRRGIKGMVLI